MAMSSPPMRQSQVPSFTFGGKAVPVPPGTDWRLEEFCRSCPGLDRARAKRLLRRLPYRFSDRRSGPELTAVMGAVESVNRRSPVAVAVVSWEETKHEVFVFAREADEAVPSVTAAALALEGYLLTRLRLYVP